MLGSQVQPSGKMKVFYIVSPSYSGSTLLTFLLASHPQIGTIGERKKFFDKVYSREPRGSRECSCGETFNNCRFWLEVKRDLDSSLSQWLKRLRFTNFQLYESRILNRLAYRAVLLSVNASHGKGMLAVLLPRLRAVRSANVLLIESVLRHSNAEVFLDSSKSVLQCLLLDSDPRLDVRPILLYRDGRAYAYSILRREPQRDIREIASEWLNIQHLNHSLLRHSGIKCHSLRYEDLCNDPKGELEQIFKFADLSPIDATETLQTSRFHVMGNEMRLRKDREIQNKEEWRQRLSQEQIETFSEIAGAYNSKLGYGD